jgi:hypothetical protein
MRNPTGRSIMQILIVFVTVTFSLNVVAASRMPASSRPATPQLTQSYTWYDGDREQTVWLNPQAVAEFNPGQRGVSAARSADANATQLHLKQAQQGVRLWQMNNTGNAAIHGLARNNPSGKYSPVFHDGPSSAASMRALPGNIIVYLNPVWDATLVDAWVKKRKLEIVKKLDIGPNIYVIKTGPGIEALDTANALYKSGEVNAAFPDWWQGVVAK